MQTQQCLNSENGKQLKDLSSWTRVQMLRSLNWVTNTATEYCSCRIITRLEELSATNLSQPIYHRNKSGKWLQTGAYLWNVSSYYCMQGSQLHAWDHSLGQSYTNIYYLLFICITLVKAVIKTTENCWKLLYSLGQYNDCFLNEICKMCSLLSNLNPLPLYWCNNMQVNSVVFHCHKDWSLINVLRYRMPFQSW